MVMLRGPGVLRGVAADQRSADAALQRAESRGEGLEPRRRRASPEVPRRADRRKAGRLWRRGPRGSPRAPCGRCCRPDRPFRKCTPSTIVSQVSTISWPSGGRSTAASSRSDSADTSVASGAKCRAIMSNSPMPFSPAWPPSSTIARPVGGELARPRLMAELVEDAIHHLRLVVAEKRMGDVDIFGDDHARRAHRRATGSHKRRRAGWRGGSNRRA